MADYADTPTAPVTAASGGAYTSSAPSTSAEAVEPADFNATPAVPANVSTKRTCACLVRCTRSPHSNGDHRVYKCQTRRSQLSRVLFTYISNCYACNVHSTVNWTATALNFDAYRAEVAAAATEYGVDPALLRAVIHAESAFNPNAVSTAGAQGPHAADAGHGVGSRGEQPV